jgi:hypothetical protein
MNSHQRRLDRRRWRHQVEIEYTSHSGYLRQFRWCRYTFGPRVCDGWRERPNQTSIKWQFTNEKKAMLFKLKWGHLEYY